MLFNIPAVLISQTLDASLVPLKINRPVMSAYHHPLSAASADPVRLIQRVDRTGVVPTARSEAITANHFGFRHLQV